MIVAMIAVSMMQMPAHHVIEMVAVRCSLVAALWAVGMLTVMPLAIVAWRAVVGVGAADGDGVFIDVTLMDMVQMTIV
jgi:hypothetical protein